MSILYKSPAKIIISGEHSVVYGKLAVSAAISLYTTVQVQKNDINDKILIQYNEKLISCNFEDLEKPTNQDNTILAIIVFLKLSGLKITSSILIGIQSDIPDRAGLGSSASFVVSLVSSLYEFLTGNQINIDKLIEISKQIENIYHGTQGSGLDVVTSIYGGILAFNKTDGFKQIDLNILNGFKILLINTGKKKQGGTSQVISQVSQRIKELNNEGIDIIEQMGCLTQDLNDNFINQQNHKIFQKQILYNQQLLDNLGVVDFHAKQIVQLCEKRNVACKITGAGNGGFCIAFINNEQYQQKLHIDLSNDLEQFGYEIILTQISHQGYHKI